jgi:hypothetical protein
LFTLRALSDSLSWVTTGLHPLGFELFAICPSRSSQHEVGILYSINTGRIFSSSHVFPDLEVSSLFLRPVDLSFFALLVMFYLWQSGIEWAISLFIHLFMVLEHLISTSSEVSGLYALAIGISHVSNTLPVYSPFWSKCGHGWRHRFRSCTASDKSHH